MSEKRYSVEAEDRIGNAASMVPPGRAPVSARLFPAVLLRKARDVDGVREGAETAVSEASASSGSPLPGDVRSRFESSLGADLTSVRVHTGRASAEAATAVGARAYTVGSDIHFGDGEYAPSDPFGLHLLAHEVAHTQQQAGGAPSRQHELEVSTPGDAAEHEADRAADAMLAGRHVALAERAPGLARDVKPQMAPKKGELDRDRVSNLIQIGKQAGDTDEINEIYNTLQLAIENPQRDPLDPDLTIVTIRGETVHLLGEDVQSLSDEASNAYWEVKDAATAPLPQTQGVSPKDRDAARAKSASNAETIRARMTELVHAGDEAGLTALERTLGAATTSPAKGEDLDPDATHDVVIDGKMMTLVQADLDALMEDVKQAHEAMHPNLDEKAGGAGVAIDNVAVSVQIKGDRLLQRSTTHFGPATFHPELRTGEGDTTVTIRATATALSISFNPPILLQHELAQTGHVSAVRVPFRTGKPTVEMETSGVGKDPTDSLSAGLIDAMNGAIAGTPISRPGYNPFQDRDLAGTLGQVQANLSSMGSGGGSGEPAPDDQVRAEDISHRALSVAFKTTRRFAVGSKDGQLQIPAGTAFDVTVRGVDEANLAAPDVKDVTVRGGPMTIVSSDGPVATIGGVVLARGGAVTVSDLKLLGKADTLGSIEKLLRLLGGAAEAHDQGASDPDALQRGAQGANDDATRALVTKMLEDEFTKAAHDAILQNRHVIPSVDLAAALALPEGVTP